nr:hypothetical protein Iba_chr02bCG2690 [Ipomoea batatas]
MEWYQCRTLRRCNNCDATVLCKPIKVLLDIHTCGTGAFIKYSKSWLSQSLLFSKR